MDENNVLMSAEINEISAALSAFQGSIKQPELSKQVSVKTKGGYTYGFKYADLFGCMKAAAEPLKANGLCVTQLLSDGKLITILAHKSGQWIRSEVAIGNTSDYQALGSAITYLKRYSYCAILGIVADSDDDANLACGNTAREVPMEDAELKLALKQINAAKSGEEVNNIYNYYAGLKPHWCQPGAKFYNAVGSKNQSLKNGTKDA